MKTFKQIDCWINFLLLGFFFITCLVKVYPVFLAYFVIGAWQVFSMIVHTCCGWFMRKGGARQVFHTIVIIIGLLVLLGNWFPPFLLIFFFLLFGTPVLALIYTIMCYDECKEMKNRPLSLLK